jgi:hypothetical protein
MVSSGILRRVALVRTDVSEKLSASLIRVTRIDELGTTLAVTSNRRTLANVPSSPILVTLMKEALSSSETSVLTRATRRNIPEDGILHSHRRENLKSYIFCSILQCLIVLECTFYNFLSILVGKDQSAVFSRFPLRYPMFHEWGRRGTCIGYW